MSKLYCTEGRHEVKTRGNAGERWCPEHPDCELRTPRKASTKAPGRKGTASYDRARRLFNSEVCGKRCFFADADEFGDRRRPDHICRYPLDGHHLVEKQFIERNYSDLPERDFLQIIFNSLIGAPLCQVAHPLVTVNSDYIYFEELRIEVVEFCEEVDAIWLDVPLPGGGHRQSMLERLRSESPSRPDPTPTERTAHA